jgi:DNA-binding GntR family transcriptional regulator
VGEQTGQPEYRRVMDDLRAQIASGGLAVGAPIPSTAELKEQHDVSVTVVRRAVAELKEEGLLQGQPGKGVYVQAEPNDVPTAHSEEFQAIMREIREIRGQMEGMNERLDDGSQELPEGQLEDASGEAASS